jgi:hypothetical protein
VLFVVGALAYQYLEGLSAIDSMYLSAGVITTVGLVIVPVTPAGRVFTAVFNVASLGLGALYLAEVAESRRTWVRRVFRRGGAAPTLAWDVGLLAFGAVPPILVATAVFSWLEGWSAPESFYFSLITATGLGMGDVEPKQPLSRLLFTFYVFSTMGVALALLGSVGTLLHEYLAARSVGLGKLSRSYGIRSPGRSGSGSGSGSGGGSGSGSEPGGGKSGAGGVRRGHSHAGHDDDGDGFDSGSSAASGVEIVMDGAGPSSIGAAGGGAASSVRHHRDTGAVAASSAAPRKGVSGPGGASAVEAAEARVLLQGARS